MKYEIPEEIISKVVDRAIELRTYAMGIVEENKILLEVAGFKLKDEGDMDMMPTYTHKDYPGVTFESEDGSIYEPCKKEGVPVKSISKAGEKLCKFLARYLEIQSEAFRDAVIGEDDVLVGEYIESVDDEGDMTYEVKLKNHYGVTISRWITKREEAQVHYRTEQYRAEDNFWKGCDAKIKEQHDREERIRKFNEKHKVKA